MKKGKLLKRLYTIFGVRQRNICKNCWYYHKNIKKCRLSRSNEMGNVGISVSKYYTCEDFIR